MQIEARDAALLAGFRKATDSEMDMVRDAVEQLAVKRRRLDEQARADHIEHIVTMRGLTVSSIR